MNDEMIVDGFIFGTASDAELAREEASRIEYLDANMNYANISKVMQLYDKALDTKMFRTPVGWKYMGKLKDILLENGYVAEKITQYLSVYVRPKRKSIRTSASMR